MKELLDITNKTEWITTLIYRISMYICWFLFAFIFKLFISDNINDIKLVILVISLIIVYGARVFFKSLYKNTVDTTFYNLKHAIEIYYYKKIKHMNYANIENINKNELSNKIIEVAYNYTKIIYDLGEFIIPSVLGVFIIFVRLIDINEMLGILSLLFLIFIIYYSYYKVSENDYKVTNYNELLKDFINKMKTIKKQNTFDYSVNALNTNRDNDSIVLKDNDTNDNGVYNKLIIIFISIVLISTFIFIRNTITRLGNIIFLIIIIIKLQDLLYGVLSSIKNMFQSSKNKAVLDEYFKNNEEIEIENHWKVISIKDGLVNYKDTTQDIKIPEFHLEKKDHISILGKSGQGKSTVLNVLSGIFKLDKGIISYDKKESKKVVDAFYLSSDVDIYNLTLRENLLLDKVKNDEYLLDLFNEINLTDWYNTLSKGLDTILTDDLDQVIKLKINILRAIISEKDLYFFDEPTLNFDIDSEKKFANILKKRLKDKTYIIVSKSTVITNGCKKHYFIKDHTLLENEPLL